MEADTKIIQRYALQILKCLDRFSKENHLTYYLAGGTLLGAVRHKGFIPWDDDIDIMMPRKDYQRLIQTFHDDRYRLISCDTDAACTTQIARIYDTHTELEWEMTKDAKIGIFIDIFPIDGFPAGRLQTNLHLYHLKWIKTQASSVKRLAFGEKESYQTLKKVIRILCLHDGNYYAKKMNRIAQKYDFDAMDYVGVKNSINAHLFKEKNDKHIFDETIYLPFEDMMAPAPKGYDTYLRHLYGDYMQIPPADKQKTDHHYKLIIKEDL